jgi:hypothetical protein|tara:strand:+ start:471 stop:677 length:207 start_codon:yes stop_codon:yes gene_type:complete
MTDINLQQDNHQDKVNNKMLKYVESISTIALSNRSQIRDLQKTVKYFCFVILGLLTCIGLLTFKTWGI